MTFSASVAQTVAVSVIGSVAVSVIGYPVQLKCTMLYPLMYPVHPVLYSVQLKCTVLYPVYPVYPVLYLVQLHCTVLYPVQLKSTRCCAQSHLLCRAICSHTTLEGHVKKKNI